MDNGSVTMENKKDIYGIFEDFIEKTVIEKKSYLTDFPEEIFNKDNLQAIKVAYIENEDTSKDDFSTKIFNQVKNKIEEPYKCQHIITNLLYLRDLPNDGISNDRKQERINPFNLIKIDKHEEGEKQEKWGTLFPSEHIASYRTDRSTHSDFVELILLYEYLLDKENKENKDVYGNIKDWVLNKGNCRIKGYENYQGLNSSLTPIDHMLLHLCDPDNYSTTSSMAIKQRIVESLYKLYMKKDYDKNKMSLKEDGVDSLLKELSDCEKLKGIASSNNLKHWSSVFWYSEIRSQWQGGYVANAYEILTKYQKQVILYGAPGTGKTYSAEQIIKEFIYDVEYNKAVDLKDYQYKDNYDWRKDDDDSSDLDKVELDLELKNKNVIWEMVQFNQSYSYEDFIEGFRPAKNNELKLVHGIFKRFAKVAAQEQNKKKKFIFIVDEINRGKIDKIFGELLYLLEYRDKKIRLHYSNDDFSIPENVYIIGTMNTADKSIALLDVALRRRFWFVRCAPQRSVLLNKFCITGWDNIKIEKKDEEPTKVKKLAVLLFDWLNGNDKKPGILDNLGSDADELKIGHSYFLKLIPESKDQDITFSDLKNIWFYSIVPLIEEYCGFDKARVEELLKKNKFNLNKKDDFTMDNLSGI